MRKGHEELHGNDDVFDMRPSYGDVVYFFVRDNVPILLGKKPYLGPPSMPEKVHEHRAQNLFVNFNSHQTRLLEELCCQWWRRRRRTDPSRTSRFIQFINHQ